MTDCETYIWEPAIIKIGLNESHYEYTFQLSYYINKKAYAYVIICKCYINRSDGDIENNENNESDIEIENILYK